MGLGHLVDAAAGVWQVPDVDADYCVHSHLETATCARCLDACPRQAWVMDDEMLGIDMEACDGCSLCIPACPEGAIRADSFPELRTWRGESLAFAACEHAVAEGAGGRVPCLHGAGLRDLLRIYGRGVTRFVVSRGSCETCARMPQQERTLDGRVIALNTLLESRGLPKLVLVTLNAADWQSLHGLSDDGSQPALSRRDFLRRATATAADHAVQKIYRNPEPGEAPPAPGRMLTSTVQGDLRFFVPAIDAARCNGCDACAHICPHQAIAAADGDACYQIDADACTGCRLCIDVCDQEAVSVQSWAKQSVSRVMLITRKCSGCGADFHAPVEKGDPGHLCRICRQAGHFRNLYQVMP